MADSDSTTPSPIDAPPAYEFSQSDYDRKLAAATERSLSLSERERHVESWGRGGDVQHSAVLHQTGTSAHTTEQHASVRPLNIKKKTNYGTNGHTKERPGWFDEAQLGSGLATNPSSSGQSGGSRHRSLPVPREHQHQRGLSVQHIIPEEPDEDRSIPPPPFIQVDNSLDGPAYERHANGPRVRRAASPMVVLRYSGEDLSASPPPSPPQSPVAQNATLGLNLRQRTSSPNFNNHHAQHHASQQARQRARTPIPRPTSPLTKPAQYSRPPPRMDFDPSVAYGGARSVFGQLPVDTVNRSQGAAALYNSAVAPHFPSQPSLQPSAPKVKRYAPSITSLPEYEQRQSNQSSPSIHQPYATPEFAASRASFHSQGSNAQYPQVARYQQTAQYPQMAQYPIQHGYATHSAPSTPQGTQQQWSAEQKQYYRR